MGWWGLTYPYKADFLVINRQKKTYVGREGLETLCIRPYVIYEQSISDTLVNYKPFSSDDLQAVI